MSDFKPIQLRWNVDTKTNLNYSSMNFGESKGKTFPDVLIYPTKEMEHWLYNDKVVLKNSTKAKFYVAISRAKYSVGIISNFADGIEPNGIQFYRPS